MMLRHLAIIALLTATATAAGGEDMYRLDPSRNFVTELHNLVGPTVSEGCTLAKQPVTGQVPMIRLVMLRRDTVATCA